MEFLKINKLFSTDYYAVPDYQRDYEWTGAQNTTLIDDIFSMIDDNGTHFIGAIVTVPYEEINASNKSVKIQDYGIDSTSVRHIVDGQQRLTSLSVFICALKKCITDDLDLNDSRKSNLKSQLDAMLLGNDFNDESQKAPHLILNGNTGRCYNKAILQNSDLPFDARYKGANKLLSAFDLFVKTINDKKNEYFDGHAGATADGFYKAILEVLTKKITLVEIRCDGSSNAFQVFDSLNGKGLDLTAADRIKNIMMSWSDSNSKAQKWDALVSEVGDDHLVSFFVSLFFYEKAKRISRNKLPDEFKNRYQAEAKSDYDGFYSKLKGFGSIYGKLRKHNTPNAKLNDALNDFESLGIEQIYVMLFSACVGYNIDLANPSDEFKNFVNELTKIIVRMQICDKSMNRLDIFFANCITEMKNHAPLTKLINNEKDYVSKAITNDQFKECFSRFSTSDSKVSEFYLRHIENKMREDSGDRTPVTRGLTVEHIIPQGLSDLKEWYGENPIPEEIREDSKDLLIERLGNKALLYGDDNSSASNNNYSKKINVYENGKLGQNQGTPKATFKMINSLLEKYPDKFNHEEVDKRSETLADYALRIW